MIQADQFDIKTGKPIQVVIDGQWQPAIKQIENSYLEYWCQTNHIDTERRFSVAQFYESVHDADRLQLEAEGRYLVCSNGSEGLFTDYQTAQLMTLGSETVAPIYADNKEAAHNGGKEAAHNAVAYGSLVTSDGFASTTLSSARILVIDDQERPPGSEHLAALYDKMGDGTMLVSERTMQSLLTVEEKEQIALKAAQANASIDAAEQQERTLARRSVYQFRAASPSLPGIAKGTVSSSRWCERLEVDAIISVSDIKGDDGRFSKPGIQKVPDFWINRKAMAKYGQQTVGPQVKYTIPKATRHEINPIVQEKAEQLAAVADDYDALSQRYLEQKDKENLRPYQDNESESSGPSQPDWLYNALSADTFGQLSDEAHIVRGLNRHVSGEWKRLATNGTSVPSAMAQHHSQLKPWEVCNKDLPHGAIVAYYRSPFPNVGAAAIAINNREIIQEQDKEAFAKQGVAYLPPYTAKEVAITDFDGDLNGFFVGYTATVENLPEKLRDELADVEDLEPDQQYGYARDLFEEMIERYEQEKAEVIAPADYPMAVKEFIEKNAPDVKPPQVVKQKKEKHSWREGETYSAATWRAWSITADNPTGMVANACMSLQALANELEYAPESRMQSLLHRTSEHFSKVLKQADLPTDHKDKIHIPSDEWLSSQGFSGSYREKIAKIAGSSGELNKFLEPQAKEKFIEESLDRASFFLSEVANGPGSVNLQTAVDTAKSAKGINTEVHDFMKALRYSEDHFRKHRKSTWLYKNGKGMPTNLEEPVSWGAELVNEQYDSAVLQERRNEAFQDLFPKGETPQQRRRADEIIQTSNHLTGQAKENKDRHRERRAEDHRPTVQVIAAGNRQLTLQNIDDTQGSFPWRSEGAQPHWSIRITHNSEAKAAGKRFPAELRVVDAKGQRRTEPMGYVDAASAKRFKLEERFEKSSSLVIQAPHLTTQVPWAQQNDSKLIYAQLDQYLDQAFAVPEGKDPQVHEKEQAVALWRKSVGGRNLVMQHFPEQLERQLQSFSTLLSRVENSTALVADGPRTVQFATHEFINQKQQRVQRKSVSVAESTGEFQHLGYISNAVERVLPEGHTFMAAFDSVYNKDGSLATVVRMHLMELPTIEQTPAEMAAMSEGRRHLTLDGEPYAEYGIRAGDILIAQAEDSREQVALRVQGQHILDEKLAAKPGAIQRWAEAEKSVSSPFFDQLTQARVEGKELWGLNVQPLGTYERGRIQPFETAVEQPAQLTVASQSPPIQTQPTKAQEMVNQPSGVMAAIAARGVSQQPANTPQPTRQSGVATGVMAALSRNNPKWQQQLQQAEQSTTDKPSKQTNKAVSNQPPKARPRSIKRGQSAKKAQKQKDSGMGY
ncbi:hypothetical protein S7335_967 [Synechococcus sp. PCC 7335]|uniref:hypothetical protein n=1 Tax=Synechococcus sp. (strain ATCC 29403 / PCC 7335) TaxID=91464 RepID=UPI00017EC817|nr:hypothetical protein [Synechococcus sp. PCC 7335]EDX82666.1 hypothetical protein S7335_967 [Synechococcus sp. PCC 7335]